MSIKDCGEKTLHRVILGIDVEPAQIALMQQKYAIPRLTAEFASISDLDTQPHLWWDYADNESIPDTQSQQPAFRLLAWRNNQSEPTYDEDPYYNDHKDNPFPPQRMFVSALHTNTTTGILRQHAMRFNSTMECRHIEQSQFPKECTGEKPFQVKSEWKAIRDTGLVVCAPGEFDKFPWTLSRNRQDITEELYIDLNISSADEGGYSNTMYCNASATRGYFELRNIYNNQTYSPLMDKWPTRDEMWSDYNDFFEDYHGGTYIPLEE
jgi:hypothetical protein